MKHWYPQRSQPSAFWYWGWALYVNRRGYLRPAIAFAVVTLGAAYFSLAAGALIAGLGALLFAHSVLGHALVYGHPARGYFARMLALADVRGAVTIADLHIGTWRHTYALLDLLPEAVVHSVNIWQGEAHEGAVRELHELELPPPPSARLLLEKPAAGSCDVVMLGLGTHEVAAPEKLFDEAKQLLKPSGKLLFFEHAKNWQSFLIFGPGIAHWTERAEWTRRLAARFTNVRSARTPLAVDIFTCAPGSRHST